jgi:poly(3-hydroxybutyrate) depolymerase
VKVVVPEGGGEGRPLLVFLHGRSGDEGSYVHEPMLDALKALGSDAPVVAFPDGDGDKYWHDRASGALGGGEAAPGAFDDAEDFAQRRRVRRRAARRRRPPARAHMAGRPRQLTSTRGRWTGASA